MRRVLRIVNGKKLWVNIPSWGEDSAWGDQVGVGTQSCIMPFISLQPIAKTAVTHSNVTFAVAGGPAGDQDWLQYQWYSGSNSALVDGGQYTGSLNKNLTITSVTQSNAGTYWVSLTNGCGMVTSSHVALTVTTSSL